MFGHMRMHHIDRDELVQALERAQDECAVRPWAGEGHVKMVAAGFRLEAGIACRAGAAVRRHPVAEAGILPHEAAAAFACVIALIVPNAVYEYAHPSAFSCRA